MLEAAGACTGAWSCTEAACSAHTGCCAAAWFASSWSRGPAGLMRSAVTMASRVVHIVMELCCARLHSLRPDLWFPVMRVAVHIVMELCLCRLH